MLEALTELVSMALQPCGSDLGVSWQIDCLALLLDTWTTIAVDFELVQFMEGVEVDQLVSDCVCEVFETYLEARLRKGRLQLADGSPDDMYDEEVCSRCIVIPSLLCIVEALSVFAPQNCVVMIWCITVFRVPILQELLDDQMEQISVLGRLCVHFPCLFLPVSSFPVDEGYILSLSQLFFLNGLPFLTQQVSTALF